MPVKLNQIEGLMIKKFYPHDPRLNLPEKEEGFNKAINQIGSREIGNNRDRLAKIIKNEILWQSSDDYPSLSKEDFTYHLADAIISKESSILEFKICPTGKER